MSKVSDLVGKTIVDIKGMIQDSEEIIFTLNDGVKYKMYHEQDCCECVYLEEINGDIENILNSEILRFDEKIEDNPEADESQTYTFYTIATINGYVDLRWNGESNGYYSESVDFELLEKGDDNE